MATNISIVQWNARGITNKVEDLLETFGENTPDIIAIQESNLIQHTHFHINGYNNPLRFGERKNKRDGMGRGLLIAIKDSHSGWVKTKMDNNQIQKMTAEIFINNKEQIHLTNIYRKQKIRNRTEGLKFWQNIEKDNDLNDHIIVGDFNAHHTLWAGNPNENEDQIGEVIAEKIIENDYKLYNKKEVTFQNTRQGGQNTSVDLTLSKNLNKLNNITWETIDPHGSDHHVILTKWGKIYREEFLGKEEMRSKFNMKRADWETFRNKSENHEWITLTDIDIEKYRENIIESLTEICKESIPTQSQNVVLKKNNKYKTVPWWDKELTILKNKRTEKFREIRNEPREIEKEKLKEEYKRINNIYTTTLKSKKQKFKEEQIEKLTPDTKLWGFVKSFEGKNNIEESKIPPLFDENNTIKNTDSEKVEILGKHYQKISSKKNYSEHFKKRMKNHAEPKIENIKKLPNNENIHNKPITLKELKDSIYSKKDSSPGEDCITYQVFKNLPESALNLILNFFNKIWSSGVIPKKFKHAIIVPLKKPEKDSSLPSSYRPIALTDHLGKLLETIVNKRLVQFLESKGIINKEQSGFRAKRQCMDQIARLISEVEKCRKQNKQTAAVFLDLEKAYDMLWKEGTLTELKNLGVTGQTFNYILNFLKERTFQVRIGNKLSKVYQQETGTPQGAVLSPTIFNVLINKAFRPLQNNKKIGIGQFADDSALWLRAKYAPRRLYALNKKAFRRISIARTKLLLEGPVQLLIQSLEDNGFKVNCGKTVSLFFDHPNNVEMKINGKPILSKNQAKYLGFIIDKNLTYKAHIKMLKDKGIKALYLLKYMCGKKWGLKAKQRKYIYKNYVLPKFTYGEEIFDQAAKTNLKILDYIQNEALRIITKTVRHTKIELLHALSGIDPLEIRRSKKKLHLYARFTLNKTNPANKIYKKTNILDQGLNKLGKNKSLVDSTLKLIEQCEIDHSNISKYPEQFPLWILDEMQIDTTLSNIIDKKTSNTVFMKNISEQYINKNFSNYEHIYTDASKEDEKVGIGIYIKKENTKLSLKANDHISITTAELTAIQTVLELKSKGQIQTQSKMCILTDSLGACLALKGNPFETARPDIVQKIKILYQGLRLKNIDIKIGWIPSHVNIDGNEIADSCANEGRIKRNIDIDVKLGYSEIKSLADKNIHEKITQNVFNSHAHPLIKNYRNIAPNLKKEINLDYDNYLLNRLRVGATMFNQPGNLISCRSCKCPITVHHTLIECKYFEEDRCKVILELNKEGKTLTSNTILATENSLDVKKVIYKFVKKIDDIFKI